MNSRFACAVVLCSSVAAVACGSGSAASPAAAGGRGGGRGGRGVDGGAVPVVTAQVAQRDVPVTVDAIGNVEAYESVSIRSQVTGIVTDVLFHEGDFVKANDQLFTIDQRPFQAQLDQAQANLVRDEALLQQAQAQLARDKAQADYVRLSSQRNSELVERGIISKDAAQQSLAQAAASEASVKADEAAVASARAQLVAQQAAVENAKLLLAYTVIRAPISGRTGNLTLKPGNLVSANTVELTTIAQLEPVFVTFSVPASHLPEIKSRGGANALSVVATPQNEDGQAVTGTLAFVDNSVDASTDTIKLKARFENAERRLWPGEFARVRMNVTTVSNAIVVSNEAVQTGQDGQFVFVVKPDSTVEQRTVTVAQHIDDDVVISKGLAPGETVVTEGQLRLEPGAHVRSGDGSGGRGAAPGAGRGGGRGRRS
jgi:membrane fusion protein, multidrug efflux system